MSLTIIVVKTKQVEIFTKGFSLEGEAVRKSAAAFFLIDVGDRRRRQSQHVPVLPHFGRIS